MLLLLQAKQDATELQEQSKGLKAKIAGWLAG
jgi:hypothetical protein